MSWSESLIVVYVTVEFSTIVPSFLRWRYSGSLYPTFSRQIQYICFAQDLRLLAQFPRSYTESLSRLVGSVCSAGSARRTSVLCCIPRMPLDREAVGILMAPVRTSCRGHHWYWYWYGYCYVKTTM